MQKINIFKNRAAESESLEQRAVTLFKFNKMLEDCVHIDSPEKKTTLANDHQSPNKMLNTILHT